MRWRNHSHDATGHDLTTTVSAIEALTPSMTNSAESLTSSSQSSDLLSCVQRLTDAERRLTRTLQAAAPLLPSAAPRRGESGVLLPTPRTMDEVRTVLSVARTYAARTSAPPGWRSDVPIHGFVTPNPLPHQLRGGALAALQLEAARDERVRRRRAARDERIRANDQLRRNREQKVEQDRDRKARADVEMLVTKAGAAGDMEASPSGSWPAEQRKTDPEDENGSGDLLEGKLRKSKEGGSGRAGLADADAAAAASRARAQARERTAQTAATERRMEVPSTMNLSDSSSSEDEDDEDDDE